MRDRDTGYELQVTYLCTLPQKEGKRQQVHREREEGGGEEGEGTPEGARAESDVAKEDDLEEGEGQGEEGRPEEREGNAEEGRGGEEEKGRDNEGMVNWDGALPAESSEEGETFVFDIVGKGGEVEGEEVGQGERGDGEGEDGDEAMEFGGLKHKAEGGKNVSDVRGEEQFAETASEEFEGRDGVGEDDEQREEEESKRVGGDAVSEIKQIGATGREAEQTDGDDEQAVAQVDAFGAEEIVDRFVGGTKDFGEQVHAGLRETCPAESQREGGGGDGRAKVVRDGRAEGVGEGGEEEVEGAEGSHQLSVISN